jgi:hypothetical protein
MWGKETDSYLHIGSDTMQLAEGVFDAIIPSKDVSQKCCIKEKYKF